MLGFLFTSFIYIFWFLMLIAMIAFIAWLEKKGWLFPLFGGIYFCLFVAFGIKYPLFALIFSLFYVLAIWGIRKIQAKQKHRM